MSNSMYDFRCDCGVDANLEELKTKASTSLIPDGDSNKGEVDDKFSAQRAEFHRRIQEKDGAYLIRCPRCLILKIYCYCQPNMLNGDGNGCIRVGDDGIDARVGSVLALTLGENQGVVVVESSVQATETISGDRDEDTNDGDDGYEVGRSVGEFFDLEWVSRALDLDLVEVMKSGQSLDEDNGFDGDNCNPSDGEDGYRDGLQTELQGEDTGVQIR